MIYWAQLFHFYQPPTQIPLVLDKICKESYGPLLRVLEDNPHVRATFNINGALLEMLQDYGHRDIIKRLRLLGEKGEVEFTGSGKYHPILPLLPQVERQRQMELNVATSSHFLGQSFAPRGFFPPEMCYSDEIVPEVVSMGHRWIILSGVACPASWPVDKVYQVENDGKRLAVLFRDDILSNKISYKQIGPADFLEHMRQFKGDKENVYVITAMDAETYGHHIKDWEKLFLAAVYEQLSPTRKTYEEIKEATALATQQSSLLSDAEFVRQVKTVTLTDLLQEFPLAEVVSPKPSSWSTSAGDLEAGDPYPLWMAKDNEVHQLQWEHLHLCIEMTNEAQKCADNDECRFFAGIARGLLDLALHSDQFWWASRRPMWDINLIHLGLIEQSRVIVNAYRAINKSGTDGRTKTDYYHKVAAARDLVDKIVDRLLI